MHVAKRNRKTAPASARIALVIVVAVGFALTGAMWMRYNEIHEKSTQLERQVAAVQEENNRLREEIAAPFDDAYIRRVARRELGYCLPGEVIYFSDFEE